MNTYDVNMELENEDNPVDLTVDAESIVEIPVYVPVAYSHDKLKDREKPDQHPITSIIGLQDALDNKISKVDGEGLLTDKERAKLDGIESGAQANVIEVVKANGVIVPISNKTVDLDTEFTGTIGFDIPTRTLTLYGEDGSVLSTAVVPGEQSRGDNVTIKVDNDVISIHPDVMAKLDGVRTDLDSHVANVANPHEVTKAQVGLGNVDNTADADKPISTNTQAALDLKADKTEIPDISGKADASTVTELDKRIKALENIPNANGVSY